MHGYGKLTEPMKGTERTLAASSIDGDSSKVDSWCGQKKWVHNSRNARLDDGKPGGTHWICKRVSEVQRLQYCTTLHSPMVPSAPQ